MTTWSRVGIGRVMPFILVGGRPAPFRLPRRPVQPALACPGGRLRAQSPAMSLLAIRDITRSFYGVQALAGVSFEVRAGTVTGLIGPNGAGKTTLFNVISGLLKPGAGTVEFDGRDITGWRPDRITAAGLVRTFQIARGFPRLSVRENLMLYAPDQPGERVLQALMRPAGAQRRERALSGEAAHIAELLALDAVLDQPAGNLSGGQ